MEHLVIEHIFDNVPWNDAPIQISADDDLIERGIKTAKHAAPRADAPGQSRARKIAIEIPAIQLFK